MLLYLNAVAKIQWKSFEFNWHVLLSLNHNCNVIIYWMVNTLLFIMSACKMEESLNCSIISFIKKRQTSDLLFSLFVLLTFFFGGGRGECGYNIISMLRLII